MTHNLRKILVYGATGEQGSAVARQLIAKNYRVRVIVRSPEKLAPDLAAAVEVITVDFNDQTTLTAATQGVDGVFLQVPATLTPADMVTFTRRALTAIRAADGPHTVFTISSIVPDTSTDLAGPDARRTMVQLVRELAPQIVVLSPTLFSDNFSGPLRQAIDYGIIPQGIPADVPVAYLSLADQAAFVVAALERPNVAGRYLRIAGPEPLTGSQLATRLGSILGKPLQYQALEPAAVVGMLRPIIGDSAAAQVAEMYGWEGIDGSALLNPDLSETLALLPVQLTPFDQWAHASFNQPVLV